jgi:uncharacterized membrane protein
MSRAGVSVGLDGFDVAAIRCGAAGLVMLPWFMIQHPYGRGAGRTAWSHAIQLALAAGPLFTFASLGGFRFAPLPHGAVLQPSAMVLGSMLLSTLVLGERWRPLRLLGAAVIVLGLILIAGPALLQGDFLLRRPLPAPFNPPNDLNICQSRLPLGLPKAAPAEVILGDPGRHFYAWLTGRLRADPESQKRTDARAVPIDSASRPSIGLKFLGFQSELLGNMDNDLLRNILFALWKPSILLKAFEECPKTDLVGVGIPTINNSLLCVRQHP